MCADYIYYIYKACVLEDSMTSIEVWSNGYCDFTMLHTYIPYLKYDFEKTNACIYCETMI